MPRVVRRRGPMLPRPRARRRRRALPPAPRRRHRFAAAGRRRGVLLCERRCRPRARARAGRRAPRRQAGEHPRRRRLGVRRAFESGRVDVHCLRHGRLRRAGAPLGPRPRRRRRLVVPGLRPRRNVVGPAALWLRRGRPPRHVLADRLRRLFAPCRRLATPCGRRPRPAPSRRSKAPRRGRRPRPRLPRRPRRGRRPRRRRFSRALEARRLARRGRAQL
mmetsp:Transcript_8923/g.30741  ORF Transcript_8923/g.30741 Transcript_8923/m.30741 type:complete len:219 (-) Transcript_8923:135-791(-)